MPFRVGQSDLANCADGHVNSAVKPSAFANVGRLREPPKSSLLVQPPPNPLCARNHLRCLLRDAFAGKTMAREEWVGSPKMMLIKMPFPACACITKAGGFLRDTDTWKTTTTLLIRLWLSCSETFRRRWHSGCFSFNWRELIQPQDKILLARGENMIAD